MRLTQRNKIIIGIIVAAVLIITLAWSFRKKSTFVIPSSNVNTSAFDTAFYNAYSNAQVNFSNAVGLSLISISNIAPGNPNVQSVTTTYNHGITAGEEIVIGGVMGTSNNYNSPIKVSYAIPNTTLAGTRSAGQTMTVTTTAPHGLYVGSMINIQGSGTADTQADCSISANQNATINSKVLCPAVIDGTFTVYPSAGAIVSAVSVTAVTSNTIFTYTNPGVPGYPAGASSSAAGITVPVTGLPTPFKVVTASGKTLTYNSVPVTGADASGVAIGGWLFKTSNALATASYVTKDKAIETAVSTWIQGKCSYLSGSPINDAGYTANVTAINDAYATIVQAFNAGNSGIASAAIINAARKADLTTALRTFLATNCLGIYAGAPGEVDIGNSTNGYGRNLTFAANGTGVDTGAITAANITRWAKYAATNPLVASNSATTALAGGTTWTNNVTEPITGVTVEAWIVCRNFGPGSLFGTGAIGYSSALNTALAA